MLKFTFFVLAAFAIICANAEDASASDYPCSTTMNGQHAEQGPIKVYRGLEICGGMRLRVIYSGMLAAQSNAVSMLIRIHYKDGIREGLFPMVRSRDGSVWSVDLTSGCLVGRLGGCQTPAPQEMKHLLQWASRPMYLNAMDFELAFKNENGEWDSLKSENYRFQLWEKPFLS